MSIISRILESLRVNALAVRNLGLLNALLLRGQRIRAWFSGLPDPFALRSGYAAYPLWCRPGTTDLRVFYQIYIAREYSCLDDLAGAGLIIDCGANVGYSSAYFLSRFPGARVIAVEPDPGNVKILERNLLPFGGRARIVPSAIWPRPASLVVDGSGGGGAWALRVREGAAGEAAQIRGTTVGALLEASGEESIFILKMDIEGAEAGIFSGGGNEWIERTENIVIELHGEENRRIFASAMEGKPFGISRHGELTVCRRTARRS